jgi:hypothetical protein
VMMGGAIVTQMKSMASAFGADKGPGAGGLYDEAKLKARAAEMGSGVTYVSSKLEKAADGSEGYTAVYAFTDINKLKLKASPADFGTEQRGMKIKGSSEEEPLTFKFVRGKPATLTVVNPRAGPDANKKKKDAAKEQDDAMQDAMLPMMQQMLKDMRMKVDIEVAGRIVETNAQWREESRVTIMDVEMNKILADPAKFKAMTKIKNPSSAEAKALISSVPGIRVETADAVTIKFQ